MEIGSHNRSHPHLDKTNNPSFLWDQIYTSKQILEKQLGAAVDEFAYPYGSYNATTASIVRLAGYKAARACCVGRIQGDVYALRAVMAPNDLAKFANYLDTRSVGTDRLIIYSYISLPANDTCCTLTVLFGGPEPPLPVAPSDHRHAREPRAPPTSISFEECPLFRILLVAIG